ncbi:hypothetical protein [Siansivirga zeaxanthinifaciens]|uniref:Uncharacterized protein n=1 Tax=Siansivirga zeaxanthinifaciens CC-SAMT-1 TaxID=1454006 RepID=A0A0C5W0Q6_9FLAO|nr:hypothetical protein [Siansivirga zeaxanthinifaciens]AJR04921.1 hypothetical protein AW14_10315 [Siansivirga zeaxanthinifaciens CC-SAMT-1]
MNLTIKKHIILLGFLLLHVFANISANATNSIKDAFYIGDHNVSLLTSETLNPNSEFDIHAHTKQKHQHVSEVIESETFEEDEEHGRSNQKLIPFSNTYIANFHSNTLENTAYKFVKNSKCFDYYFIKPTVSLHLKFQVFII